MKTICKNWELNYICNNGCGIGIFNATEKMFKCVGCGAKLKEINPLNSRKYCKTDNKINRECSEYKKHNGRHKLLLKD